MNYSNFVSRVSIPRPAPTASDKKDSRPARRKSRKSSRRRVAAVVASVLLAAGVLGGSCRAEPAAQPRIVPAAGTVVFAEGPDRPLLIERPEDEPVVFDHPLLDHFQSVAAEVQAAAPVPRRGASLVTLILLGGGLVVAFSRLRLFFRGDLSC
jgi:hypothetical protein